MGTRLELHQLLKSITGISNVYYNPPGQMSYPAIKYEVSKIDANYADNKKYRLIKCYSVTVINSLPNDDAIEKLLALPMCMFDRHYVYDGLNHDVLKIYF